jgi:hypothetical protein
MSDLVVFWKCFAMEREKEDNFIDDRERRDTSGCKETNENKKRKRL